MDLIDWLIDNICTSILVKHSKLYNSDNRTCYPNYTIYKFQYGQKRNLIFASFHHISRLYPYLKRRNPGSSNTPSGVYVY